MDISLKYAYEDLREFVTGLFVQAGLPTERAAVMAEVFIEADLLGFGTHGLSRVPSNLAWLESGQSKTEGAPEVLSDHGNTFNWDADYLPGPWVMMQAVETAMARVPERGLVAATIRRCQHVACLAVYCARVSRAGYVALITCSTPSESTVCAHGGAVPVFSTNPIAFAAPLDDQPLLFDISMSVTARARVARARREGRPLPEACIKDNQGGITDNPEALYTDPPGSILPIGGIGHGYKGAALSILAEVMSMALGGYGRADQQSHDEAEANSVFLQIIDPAAFGGRAAFDQQLRALRDLYESSGTLDENLRFPGRRAWLGRERQLRDGVELYPGIMEDIKPWAEKFRVAMPELCRSK